MLAFVIGAASWVLVASACVASAQSTSMPSTALLSDVEISLVTGGHGGCVGRFQPALFWSTKEVLPNADLDSDPAAESIGGKR